MSLFECFLGRADEKFDTSMAARGTPQGTESRVPPRHYPPQETLRTREKNAVSYAAKEACRLKQWLQSPLDSKLTAGSRRRRSVSEE